MSGVAGAAKWVLGPLAALALGGLIGRSRIEPGKFVDATTSLSEGQRRELESIPAIAVANATWAYGSVDSVKRMLRAEIDRPETEDPRRARALVRFGIIDTNPDGQAAVFASACALDSALCDQRLKEAAEREIRARFVAPGTTLPLYFGGHP